MVTQSEQITSAISQGFAFLTQEQENDGSFVSFSSPQQNSFSNSLRFHSTFSTALILDSMTTLAKTKAVKAIQRNAAAFLLHQKSSYWSFNYWARESEEALRLPYPDDLDDTSCALSALFHYDATLIDGTVLAHVVHLLTAVEVQEGGPYRTWLVPNNASAVWRDIDVAVNSNIAYFLSLQDLSLPLLTQYIEECILANKLVSPYYPSEYPIFYFISRFYNGKYRSRLAELLHAKRNKKGNWGNPLNTSLVLSALLRLEDHKSNYDEAAEYLLQKQKDGSWKPYPFYTGVNPKKDKRYYAGSAALTTAICLEALQLYSLHAAKNREKNQSALLKKREVTEEEKIYKKIGNEADRFAQTLNEAVANQFYNVMHQVLKKDTQRQITLLPYFFIKSLSKKDKRALSEAFIIKLGFANLLGWIAYTIYDDFFDDEGNKLDLSVANICLRELTVVFATLFPEEFPFNRVFREIMNGIDSANAWEVTHARCNPHNTVTYTKLRLPDWQQYDMLAKRSLGHALGPIAILYQLNKKEAQIHKLFTFFHHYIIVKQLNDDAHDFEEDLQKGILTPVVAKLLHRFQQKQKAPLQELSLKQLSIVLKELFWYEVVDEIALDIFSHAKQARDIVNSMKYIKDKTYFEKLLSHLEATFTKAISERDRTVQFIKTY